MFKYRVPEDTDSALRFVRLDFYTAPCVSRESYITVLLTAGAVRQELLCPYQITPWLIVWPWVILHTLDENGWKSQLCIRCEILMCVAYFNATLTKSLLQCCHMTESGKRVLWIMCKEANVNERTGKMTEKGGRQPSPASSLCLVCW